MAGRASAEATKAKSGERSKLEAELDTALEDTFPASDPFSVGQFTATEPPSQPVDRQAPEIAPEAMPGEDPASASPARRGRRHKPAH
jgi:hypothetical protein